jgi:predicted nucleic acid-binding protein
MIVVADAGPIHYLVLIEAIDVLEPLYERVFVPRIVADELSRAGTPEVVRTWVAQPHDWFEVRPDPPSALWLEFLDPGERAAITLALSLPADRLLIDDWEGRVEAERRHLIVTGTLGVLAEAHQGQLLDFETSFERLSRTGFYLSSRIVDLVRRRLKKKEP